MSKFKVGDKVVVTGYGYVNRNGNVTRVEDHGVMVDSGNLLGEHERSDDKSEFHLFFLNHSALLVAQNTLQVGETYTSENGCEWECILVRDGKAWMSLPETDGPAYVFNIDGTNISQGGETHNIKWGPKRKTIHTKGSWASKGMPQPNHHHYNITFDTIDGTPDWTTAKVTPCD